MLKICPDCGRQYLAALRYCKEDGAELVALPLEESEANVIGEAAAEADSLAQVANSLAQVVAVESSGGEASPEAVPVLDEAVPVLDEAVPVVVAKAVDVTTTASPPSEDIPAEDIPASMASPSSSIASPSQASGYPDTTLPRRRAFMAELPDPETLEGFAGNEGTSWRTVVPIALALIGLLGVGGFVLTKKKDAPKISKFVASGGTPKPAQQSMPSASPRSSGLPAKGQSQPAKARPGEPSSPASSLAGEKFPQTRERRLSTSEVASWSYTSVRYAINEIYARHGYAFQNPAILKQFNAFAWYRSDSSISMEQVEKIRLSRVEFDNAKLLARRRKELEAQGAH